MKWYLKVLNQYSDFNGRARRKEYWMFFLFNALFSLLAIMLDNFFGIEDPRYGYGFFYVVYKLAMLIPHLAVIVRRLHDVGKSGKFLFIVLIPVIGVIWIFILLISDGESGNNKYGPSPKYVNPLS